MNTISANRESLHKVKVGRGFSVIKNNWQLEILNPISGEVSEVLYYPTISKIADNVKMFNYDTWRNIALGRSKAYTKFVRLTKLGDKGDNWNLGSNKRMTDEQLISHNNKLLNGEESGDITVE